MPSTTISASLSLAYGPHPDLALDAVVPADSDSRSLVICIHGGWWHQGSHHDLRALCLALAEHGHPAASIGFRPLAAPGSNPEGHQARSGADCLSDVLVGVTKAMEEAAILGWNGRGIVLLGSGSGSLLALLAAHRLSTERTTGGRVRAAIACGVTPSLDHHDGWAPALGTIMDRFAGRDRHALSPLHQSPGGYPTLLLLHGDKDPDCPPALAQKFHQKVAAANESSQIALLAGPGHHFLESPFSANGRIAMEKILPFLAEHGVESPDASVEDCRNVRAESLQPG